MTYRIVCIGEPLADISATATGFDVAYGGDTLHTAIQCGRSTAGTGVTVDYVTAIGTDTLSQGLLDLLTREGVGTGWITRDPDRQIGIRTREAGSRGGGGDHYGWDDSAARHMFDADRSPQLAAIAAADLVCLSGKMVAILSPQAQERLWSALSDARGSGARIAFRTALQDSAKTAETQIDRVRQITDIVLPAAAEDAAGVETGIDAAYLAALAAGVPDPQAIAQARDVASRIAGPRSARQAPRRMASVIRLRPEHMSEYTRLHADVWPGVLARLRASHITNYSIYLRRPEMLMFGYFEYTGDDFAADEAAIAADPVTQDWWAICGPMQEPFGTRAPGEWWAGMEEIFHAD